MTLFIDNYDSFSYNLVQLIGSIQDNISVIRNDELAIEEIKALKPQRIVLSPGPGYPKDAGICEEVIKTLKGQVPILGVCLGHQAICEVFGASTIHAKKLMHGKQSPIAIDNRFPLFKGLPKTILAARYHSLAADSRQMPPDLLVIGTDESGEIMAVKHRDYDIYGLQFHPESILTPLGREIIENFLSTGGNEL